MSCKKSGRLTRNGQGVKRKAEPEPEKRSQSESEIPVIIAMSSGLLFQKEQQSSSVSTGPAFSFVKALMEVNAQLKKHYPESEELFQVVLIDNNSSGSLQDAIQTHGLEELVTLSSVSEEHVVGELEQNKIHLFLSAEPGLEAQEAVSKGLAAAVMSNPEKMVEVSETQLRVAFDGDAVIFSNESELVFERDGLTQFLEHERANVENPMNQGPFKRFLEVLERLQRKLHDKVPYKDRPIRTYLVTSRGAYCEGYRALNTLRTWGVEIDEAVFVGGSEKGPVLQRIRPHIFFDDQKSHIKAALEAGTVACWVKYPDDK